MASKKGSVRTGATQRSKMTGLQSQKSKMSRLSMGIKNKTGMQQAEVNAIQEEEVDYENELEAKPEDFIACNSCVKQLTEDEKIINARFVNEALAASRDISVFPVCIACNFENLEASNREAKQREKKYTQMKQSKGVFFPSNKKLYDISMHQNSEEFKQLGTIHMENRASDYYPLEKPQPATFAQSPGAAIQMEKIMGASKQKMLSQSARRSSSMDAGNNVTDPDKSRSAHIKSLVAERLKEEDLRNKLVTDEIVKMKRHGPRASSAQKQAAQSLFPTTTNQEMHNEE